MVLLSEDYSKNYCLLINGDAAKPLNGEFDEGVWCMVYSVGCRVERGLLQEAVAEDAEVVGGEEELVLEIRDHASELAVDEVPSTDEIRR